MIGIVTIGIAAGTMLVMAVVMSYILGWANKKFHVEVDHRVEAVTEALPGVNCGGCGFLGCSDYAVAIVANNAPVNKCTVGGEDCAAKVAGIMGVEMGVSVPSKPVVHCGAHTADKAGKSEYRGEPRCAAAHQVAGVQDCTFGCLGFGDCQVACKYDAMHVKDGLAVVDYNKCVGCGACVKACPRKIISMADFNEDRVPAILCSNQDKGKDVTRSCAVGCIGCKACTKLSDIITMSGDLAILDASAYIYEKVEGVEKAIEKCPKNTIAFID